MTDHPCFYGCLDETHTVPQGEPMTDTREDREALIEEAAKAMYFEDCGVAALEDDAEPFREMARVALAVFEQAHAPTDDERWEAWRRGMPGNYWYDRAQEAEALIEKLRIQAAVPHEAFDNPSNMILPVRALLAGFRRRTSQLTIQ